MDRLINDQFIGELGGGGAVRSGASVLGQKACFPVRHRGKTPNGRPRWPLP